MAVEGHKEWEVEEILSIRKWGKGYRYLVKWKGHPREDASWEPRHHLAHAQEALEDFYQLYPDEEGAPPKKKP